MTRKLTKKERELICGCDKNGGCCDSQQWGYCQYSDEVLTEENKQKLKTLKKNK